MTPVLSMFHRLFGGLRRGNLGNSNFTSLRCLLFDVPREGGVADKQLSTPCRDTGSFRSGADGGLPARPGLGFGSQQSNDRCVTDNCLLICAAERPQPLQSRRSAHDRFAHVGALTVLASVQQVAQVSGT